MKHFKYVCVENKKYSPYLDYTVSTSSPESLLMSQRYIINTLTAIQSIRIITLKVGTYSKVSFKARACKLVNDHLELIICRYESRSVFCTEFGLAVGFEYNCKEKTFANQLYTLWINIILHSYNLLQLQQWLGSNKPFSLL